MSGPRKEFPGAPPESIQSIVASLQVLVYRMEDLIEARTAPHAELLVRELTADMRAWREVIQEGCRRWSEQPGTDERGELQERLKKQLANLNARIEEVLNAAEPGAVSDSESGDFYRLLGGFRGFSEAALVFAGTAEEIDWEELREERFS